MNNVQIALVIITLLGGALLIWGLRSGGPPKHLPERRGPDSAPDVELGQILLLSGQQASGKTALAERIGNKYNGFVSISPRSSDEELNKLLVRYGNPEVLIFDEVALTSTFLARAKHWAASGMKRVVVCTNDVVICERLIANPANRRLRHIHLDRHDLPTMPMQLRAAAIVGNQPIVSSKRTTFGPNDETPLFVQQTGRAIRDYQQLSPKMIADIKADLMMPRGAGKHLPESGD